jgi:hypothetical protein
VVGASYVALECAGFISGLGHDAAVMMRSANKPCEQTLRHHLISPFDSDAWRFFSVPR